ncbi:glycosyltransferase family 2 protein [Morganella psychrotolerans]|uniref:glycosyltransferase family A protein n=1 Tax=Morganella psychrotolerans TaxID=368603 RepID=UPI00168BB138
MSDKMITYSIIIPCFNAEPYLNSILTFISKTQSERNDVEFIIINDGSIDNTDYILSSKNGFHYINQENKGVSSSRNLGLQSSSGKYILFLDADDSFDDDILHILDKEIIKNNIECDTYLFNYSINHSRTINKSSNIRLYTNIEILHLFLTRKLKLHICSICFKSDFLKRNNILFPEDYCFGEDIYFILLSFLTTKKHILHIDHTLFNYNLDNSVTVQSALTISKIKVLALYDLLQKNTCGAPNKITSEIKYLQQRTFFYLIKLGLQFNFKDKETLDYLFSKKYILKKPRVSLYPVVLFFRVSSGLLYFILNKRLQRSLE